MKLSARFLPTIIIFTASVVSVTAQPQPAEQTMESPKAFEQQAQLLLDQVIADIGSLKLPQNRGRLQIISADLLWKRDQSRARSLFSDAAANVLELENKPTRVLTEFTINTRHRLSCVRNSYLQQHGTTRLWPMSCFKGRDNRSSERPMIVCRRVTRTWNNSCSVRPSRGIRTSLYARLKRCSTVGSFQSP